MSRNDECQRVLMAQGGAYPRTCVRCGLFGPCRGPVAPHPAPAAPSDGKAQRVLLEVLDAVQKYLPPDGVPAKETLSRIIGLVDPWPLASLESGLVGVTMEPLSTWEDTDAELLTLAWEMDGIYSRWHKKEQAAERELRLAPLRAKCYAIATRRYEIAARAVPGEG